MSTFSDVFTAIANAIRTKNGSSDTYTPAQMSDAILNIPAGSTPEWNAERNKAIIWKDGYTVENGKNNRFEFTVEENKVYLLVAIPRTTGTEASYNYFNDRDAWVISKTLFDPYVALRIERTVELIASTSWNASTSKFSCTTNLNPAYVKYTQYDVYEMSLLVN